MPVTGHYSRAVQRLSSTHRAQRGAERTTRTGTKIVLSSLALLLMVLAVPLVVSAHAARSTTPRAEQEPLTVRIESISPSTLSDNDRPLTIVGTVTNDSDEPWTAVNLYAFRSDSPILGATNLATSAATETDAFVGERIVTAGSEDTVDVLEPGASADFSLTVPRSEIAVVVPGVYWLGVHASGVSSLPRDAFADGRARTFIPLVPRARGKDKATVDAAIVLPIRETVWFEPDGRVAHLARWTRSLDDDGRLDALLDAGEAADVPITWLVDPAVPAAVARLAAGNPPRSLAPDPAAAPPTEEPTEEPGEEPSEPTEGAPAGPEPFAAFSDPIPPVDPEEKLTAREQALADQAQDWLGRFTTLTTGASVLALPYGDLDESAAVAHDPGLYAQAVNRSSQVMAWLGVAASPALAPRDGIISPAAISAATPDSTILVGDTSFAVPPDAPSSVVRLLGHKVVVTSTGAAAGGPGPTPADDPLALRQRLLSEAALRLLSPSPSPSPSATPSPVVMMLPADWHPREPDALVADLDLPWLSPVTVPEISVRPGVSMSAGSLAYTSEDQEAELDDINFTAAAELRGRADLLAGLLTLQNLVRQQVADEVLVSLSSGHRPHSDKVAGSVQAATSYVSAQLASVTVDAPDAVTLPGESGKLGADIVNGLDQPVTVRVAVRSGGSLELEDLGERQLAANARQRILPRVTVSRPGIHQVVLVITDIEGEPLGASTNLQIRAAQVSGLIWLLIAGGALLLFGTIALRLLKRRPRARHSSPPGASALEAAT